MLFYFFIFFVQLIQLNSLPLITLNEHNHIFLLGDVNKKNIDTTIQQLVNFPNKDIYFYINSNGGIVEEGEKLVTQMQYYQNMGKKFICVTEKAYSMAFYIFQNCNTRYITPSAKMMHHQIQVYNLKGDLKKVSRYLSQIEKISIKINTFLAVRLGLEINVFLNKIDNEWWEAGESILQFKMADHMVLVGCDYNEKYFKCPIVDDESTKEILKII